jgi:hypothetical protein
LTHPATEVRFTRAQPAPGTFRPQGLVTLSTACSLDGLVDLVSDRQRLSGSPFGAFILAASWHALPARLAPLAVSRLGVSPARGLTVAAMGHSASGSCSSESRTARPGVYSGRPTVAPMGFSLPGVCSSIWAGPSGPPPPTRLASAGDFSPTSARATEYRSTDDSPDHVGRTPLSGFLRLEPPCHSNAPATGLWVHLAGRRASRPVRDPR